MRRLRDTLRRNRGALLLLGVVVAFALVLLLGAVAIVGAQPPVPSPLAPVVWTFGGHSAEARHTWWTKPGDRVDVVLVEGGARAEVFCQGGLCVLNVHGVWVRVYADGLVAERFGVYLPAVKP